MDDIIREQKIKELAEKNDLTLSEASLVFGTGTAEDFARNFAYLQEIKGKQNPGNPDPVQQHENEVARLLEEADKALKQGDIASSVRLRRMAYESQ